MGFGFFEPELGEKDADGFFFHVAKDKQGIFDYFLIFHEPSENLL
jgi:hypothetical protein